MFQIDKAINGTVSSRYLYKYWQTACSCNIGKFDKRLHLLVFLARKFVRGMIIKEVSLNTVGETVIAKPKNICLYSVIYGYHCQRYLPELYPFLVCECN
jgi:hypothetical protein